MGYNLENKHQLFFTSSNWWFQRILELASAAGWKPLGTVIPHESNWNNDDYESQNGQFVTTEDAENLHAILNHLIETHQSITNKPIGVQKDEIEMVKNFLIFIKPLGVKKASGFYIR